MMARRMPAAATRSFLLLCSGCPCCVGGGDDMDSVGRRRRGDQRSTRLYMGPTGGAASDGCRKRADESSAYVSLGRGCCVPPYVRERAQAASARPMRSGHSAFMHMCTRRLRTLDKIIMTRACARDAKDPSAGLTFRRPCQPARRNLATRSGRAAGHGRKHPPLPSPLRRMPRSSSRHRFQPTDTLQHPIMSLTPEQLDQWERDG